MNLEYSEEQKLLRESVAKFCKVEVPTETIRELADEPKGLSDELWRKLSELGLLGVLIPEAYGGLGLGATEMGVIMEEMGRALMPGAWFASGVLGALPIAIGGTEAAKTAWLEKIALGETVATLALIEEDALLGPAHVKAVASADASGGYVLTGKKFFVPELAAADLIVVAAAVEGGADGIGLFIIEKNAAGVTTEDNKLYDLTSRSGQLILDGVEVGADAVIGTPGEAWGIVDQVLMFANVGLAAASVAGAEHVLQTTVEYARERKQFGKAIGTFQAVKHPLVNLFAAIESARSAYHYAAWAVDAASEDVRASVAVARVTAVDSFKKATFDCLQAYGGIGFTWEYDLHLFLKRAKHYQYFLGTVEDYEEIIAVDGLGI